MRPSHRSLALGLACLILLYAVARLPAQTQAEPGYVTWSAISDTFVPRSAAGAVTLSDDTVLVVGGFSAGIGTNGGHTSAVDRFDVTRGTWRARAPLPSVRSSAGIATGPDGRVYLIGGQTWTGGAAITASVLRYDAQTNTWTTRTAISAPRYGLAAATSGGLIYVFGGNPGTCCATTVEEYDPDDDVWVARTGLTVARSDLSAVSGGNGRIYVFGGVTSAGAYVGTTDEFDPSTNSWLSRAAMTNPRAGAAAARATNGRIYIAGGTTTGGALLRSLEEYDPTTNTWRARANLPQARTGATLVSRSDGRLWLVGGAVASGYAETIEVYDPVSNVWTTTRSLPTPREGLAISAATDGALHAVGGSNFATELTAHERFDPTSGVWSTRAALPSAVSRLTLTTATNGRLYAVAGESATGPVASVYEYDGTNDAWTARQSLATARSGHGTASAPNGRLYAIGGVDANGNELASVEQYDPPGDSWGSRTSMPTARSGLSVVAGANGRLYAIGGVGGGTYHATVEEYDPATDTWTARTSMNVPRADLTTAVTSDGRIYAIGGRNASGELTSVEEYDPTSNAWTIRNGIAAPRTRAAAAVAGDGRIYLVAGSRDVSALASVEMGIIDTAAGPPSTATRTPSPTATVTTDQWPQYMRDPRHTSLSTSSAPARASVRWKYASTGQIESPAVLGPDGTIYFGAGGYLHAVAPSGLARWRRQLAQRVGAVQMGLDGRVYAIADDLDTNTLFALDTAGNTVWSFVATASSSAGLANILLVEPDTSSPTVYFGVATSSLTGTLHAVVDGTVLWTYDTDLLASSSPALSADGRLYLGTFHANGALHAIDAATGTGVWITEVLGFVGSSPSIGPDGLIRVGSSNGLRAINPNGLLRWTAEIPLPILYSSPAVDAGGASYVGAGDRLYAVASDGSVKWFSADCLRDGRIESAPAISADGLIIIQAILPGGSPTARLCAIDNTGLLRWRIDTATGVESTARVSSPLIASDGLVYVGSPDGHLYAIEGPLFQRSRRLVVPLAPSAG